MIFKIIRRIYRLLQAESGLFDEFFFEVARATISDYYRPIF